MHIHRSQEIIELRRAGKLAADTLSYAETLIRPGITTKELDELLHTFVRERGAVPAPLGYTSGGRKPPFTGSCCTSVNNVICHGVPSTYRLKDGDIINVDVTPKTKQGWHGDTSATFFVGEPSPEAKRLVETTKRAMLAGIKAVRPGARMGDVGHAIQSIVESEGFSVVREYTGHGTGKVFHTSPTVHHWGNPGEGIKIKRGMVFTVEPMVNMGGPEIRHYDDWVVLTQDGKLSAQFEHTVLVTKKGVEILTRRG